MRNAGVITKTIYALIATWALIASAPAGAVVFTEIGDAGELPATAQLLPAGTTLVNGSLAGDADLFRFAWGGGALTIDTNDPLSSVDTQLFLFDSIGAGIFSNDDLGIATLKSQIVAVLAAGEYLIGVSTWDYDPQSVSGEMFPNTFIGQFAPIVPPGQTVTGWAGGSTGGDYIINISAASVPEPLSALLFGVGLIGLGLGALRSRS